MSAPDLPSAITAWRLWRLAATGDRYRLSSLYKWAIWEPGEALKAECLEPPSLIGKLFGRSEHSAPFAACGCGIYAADLDLVCAILESLRKEIQIVVGEVSLWGSVLECDHGFRSALAYPLRLYVSAETCSFVRGDVIAALSEYRVPVEILPVQVPEAGDELLRRTRTARAA